jgi:hypothetical protein
MPLRAVTLARVAALLTQLAGTREGAKELTLDTITNISHSVEISITSALSRAQDLKLIDASSSQNQTPQIPLFRRPTVTALTVQYHATSLGDFC